MKIVLFRLSIVMGTAQFLFKILPNRYLGTKISVSDTESASGTNVGGGSEEKVMAPVEEKQSNLTLLLKVIQISGKPLPVSSFTARVVAAKIKKMTGFNPTEVEVMNSQEVVIDFDPEVPIVELPQKVHGPILWEGMNSEISCLMSTRKSVLNIVSDREESRNLQKELQEQRRAKEEEGEYVGKLEGLLTQFGEEVKGVEELEREILALKEDSSKILVVPSKLMKPPDLPLFSGVEPGPKDEGSFDQWLFQIQGAMDSHCEEAVKSAIVRSVREEARELMRFRGVIANLDTILIGIEERFRRGPSADKLQQEYYQLQQEKGKRYNSLPVG